MKFKELKQWLAWLENIHVRAIDLEPGRFEEVYARLGLQQPTCPVVTVAGTNGKGSVVAILEAILLEHGYRVGSYTSPYIYCFNEQIRLRGRYIPDKTLLDLFEHVHKAQQDTPLTLFEFKTLIALLYFQQVRPDVMLLEIGLGGRLDPVNIIDADIAVITSIGLDHCERLGYTREAIAKEKAGIFRPKQKIICGEADPPLSLLTLANENEAQIYFRKKDYLYHEDSDGAWTWKFGGKVMPLLFRPGLLLKNAATSLMAIEMLENFIQVSERSIRKGLSKVNLAGRHQVVQEKPLVLVDVAHNPDGVWELTKYLAGEVCQGKTYAVFSMLSSKDVVTCVDVIKTYIDEWLVAPIGDFKSSEADEISALLTSLNEQVSVFPSISNALTQARLLANPEDRIIVFGSFHVAAEVLQPLVL